MYNNQHQQNHYDYDPQYEYHHPNEYQPNELQRPNEYQQDTYAMNGLTHHQDKYAANDFTHQQDTYAMNDLTHQQDKYATNDLTHQQDTYATNDFTHQQNTYATSDLTHQQYNQQQDYSYYNENKPTPATADGYYTAPNPSSQVDVNEAPATVETEKYARGNSSDKRSCCDLLCCGCCTCCPQWCRYILCIIFLIIVVLGITAGILAALFKKPSVEFTGVQGSPIFGLTGNKVNLNVSLGFTVNNPNVESATFSTLTATVSFYLKSIFFYFNQKYVCTGILSW